MFAHYHAQQRDAAQIRPFPAFRATRCLDRQADQARLSGLGMGPARGPLPLSELRLYDLRHAYGQWLSDAGAPEAHIQAGLRHKTAAMTRRYTMQRDVGKNGRVLAGCCWGRSPRKVTLSRRGSPREGVVSVDARGESRTLTGLPAGDFESSLPSAHQNTRDHITDDRKDLTAPARGRSSIVSPRFVYGTGTSWAQRVPAIAGRMHGKSAV